MVLIHYLLVELGVPHSRSERGQETEETKEARRSFTTSEPRPEPAFLPNSVASPSMERDSCSGGGGGGSRKLAMAVDSSSSSSKLWEWKSLGQAAAKDLGSRGKKGGLDDDKKQEGEQNKPCTGLKLGKRTYFDDKSQSQSQSQAKTTMTTTAAATATTTAAAGAPASNSPPKKGRSSPQGGAVPKCQVEGCTADLSGCKDYHRRHKVCEVHSKTPKNTVNGQEQRFCQQCSRFHLLSEFDEGKRSCRRRLAGHNERRRKPQPDVLAAYSMGNHSFQAAYQRFGPSILIDGHGFPRSSWSQLGSQLADNLSAEKLLLLLQNTKRTPASAGSTAAGSPSTVTPKKEQMGLLSLSPSPGAGGGGGGGTTSTSRALSLLSAEPWTSSTNASASTTTTTTTTTTAYHSQVRPQQDYLMLSSSTQAQDAIPISSASMISSTGSRAYASPMHHRLLSMDQQQQQQQGRIDLGRQPPSSSSFEQRML